MKKALIQAIALHRVIGNTDTIEEKGRPLTLGWFTDPKKAARFAKRRDPIGTRIEVEPRTELIVQVVDDDGRPIAGEMHLLGECVELDPPDPLAARRAKAKKGAKR